jgi:hypothetical protein
MELQVIFWPKRISLCKHSDFSDPKNRSMCAFIFGARGGNRFGSFEYFDPTVRRRKPVSNRE